MIPIKAEKVRDSILYWDLKPVLSYLSTTDPRSHFFSLQGQAGVDILADMEFKNFETGDGIHTLATEKIGFFC